MARLLLFVVLAIIVSRTFWRIVDGFLQGVTGRDPRRPPPRSTVAMTRDPVCGTFVVPERAVSIADGRARIYFCSNACRDAYRARTA